MYLKGFIFFSVEVEVNNRLRKEVKQQQNNENRNCSEFYGTSRQAMGTIQKKRSSHEMRE